MIGVYARYKLAFCFYVRYYTCDSNSINTFPSTSRFFAFHLAYNLYIPGPSIKKCQSTGDTSGSVPHGRHRLDDAAKCLGGTSGVSKSDC